MKYSMFIGAAMLMAFATGSCGAATAPNYEVNVKYSPDEDGMMLYIVDYDNGAKIDSTLIDESGSAIFKGYIETPVMAMLVLDGARQGQFILEAGAIEIEPMLRKTTSSGELYGRLQDFNQKAAQIVNNYNIAAQDTTKKELMAKFEEQFVSLNDSVAKANADNVIGLSLFLQSAYDMTIEDLDKAVVANPYFGKSIRVNKLRDALKKKKETSVGNPYKDFEVTYDGETKRLSDYVGKDHYTLVDFWASWCGPCIRETKVIKEIYDKYNGKGLEVVGVAVWDEPDKTKEAIRQHNLPWKQIINAQTIPTDIYGISGIPCIILIDPSGKIVSRDKQDEELKADVEAAMQNYTTVLQPGPLK